MIFIYVYLEPCVVGKGTGSYCSVSVTGCLAGLNREADSFVYLGITKDGEME